MSSIRDYSDVKAMLEGMRVGDLHKLLDERDWLSKQLIQQSNMTDCLMRVLADVRSKIAKTATGFETTCDRNADVIDGFYRGALTVVLDVIDTATKPFYEELGK